MSEEAYDYFFLAIRRANYFWIFLSLFLSFIAFLIRAYRWRYTLEAIGYQTGFWNRYHALMIGYLVNMTIPRAGEVSRAAMLLKTDNVPFSKSFGTVVAERIIDLLMLSLISGITILVSYNDFFIIFDQIGTNFSPQEESDYGLKFWFYSTILALGLIFLLLLALKPSFRDKVTSFIKNLIEGLMSVFRCKNPFQFLIQTLLIWSLYVVYFGVAFYSLPETSHFPAEGILLGFIAGALGISFTNGGIGAFPFLVSLVVVFYLQDQQPDTAQAIGNALGMLIWVSQTILLVLLGLISLILLPTKKINNV